MATPYKTDISQIEASYPDAVLTPQTYLDKSNDHTPITEVFTVPGSEFAHTVKLDNAVLTQPDITITDTTTSTVLVPVSWSKVPGAAEVACKWDHGLLRFHSSREDNTISVLYQPAGKVYDAQTLMQMESEIAATQTHVDATTHEQNTDTGTSSDTFRIGAGNESHLSTLEFEADFGGLHTAAITYNADANVIEIDKGLEAQGAGNTFYGTVNIVGDAQMQGGLDVFQQASIRNIVVNGSSASVTNNRSVSISAPTGGTNRTSLYVTQPTGGTTNKAAEIAGYTELNYSGPTTHAAVLRLNLASGTGRGELHINGVGGAGLVFYHNNSLKWNFYNGGSNFSLYDYTSPAQDCMTITAGTNRDITFRPRGTGSFNLLSTDVATVPLKVKGADSQTGDLQRWIDSVNTTLARISSDGSFHTSGNANVAGTLTVGSFNNSTPSIILSTSSDGDNPVLNYYITANFEEDIVFMKETIGSGTVLGNVHAGTFSAATINATINAVIKDTSTETLAITKTGSAGTKGTATITDAATFVGVETSAATGSQVVVVSYAGDSHGGGALWVEMDSGGFYIHSTNAVSENTNVNWRLIG